MENKPKFKIPSPRDQEVILIIAKKRAAMNLKELGLTDPSTKENEIETKKERWDKLSPIKKQAAVTLANKLEKKRIEKLLEEGKELVAKTKEIMKKIDDFKK